MLLRTTLLLLILLLIAAPAIAQLPERWYKVISPHNGIWDSSSNIFIKEKTGSDSISLSGYTNHGATVAGIIRDGRIIIPMQKLVIKPKGGNGSKFIALAEADGRITDSILTLQFYYKQDSYSHTAGTITAARWSIEAEAARAQLEKQAADARREMEQAYALREKQKEEAQFKASTRDTMIDGELYRWIVYDFKHMMVEIGQSYENHVKNGRWLYTDDYGRLDNIHKYVDGVLNGWTISYFYEDRDVAKRIFGWWLYKKKHIIRRSQGLYVNGKHIGRWTHDEAPYNNRKKRRWKPLSFDTYDLDGNIMSRTETYKTGAPAIETFYAKNGAMIWYIHYDKKGNVLHEGQHQTLILLEQ